MNRRTFLFLGASAAVGLALPAAPAPVDWGFRNGSVLHFPEKMFYARVRLERAVLEACGTLKPGEAWRKAVEVEYLHAIQEHERNLAASLVIPRRRNPEHV